MTGSSLVRKMKGRGQCRMQGKTAGLRSEEETGDRGKR